MFLKADEMNICRFRENLGMKVIKAMQRDSDAVTHAAIDMIVTLLCVS